MANRLYVSFWDLCVDNLPQGRFERRMIGAGYWGVHESQTPEGGALCVLCLPASRLWNQTPNRAVHRGPRRPGQHSAWMRRRRAGPGVRVEFQYDPHRARWERPALFPRPVSGDRPLDLREAPQA
jgi:hypothetical protein